jgi:Flp pilus assembly pilin Flp
VKPGAHDAHITGERVAATRNEAWLFEGRPFAKAARAQKARQARGRTLFCGRVFTKGGDRAMINKVFSKAGIALRRFKNRKGQTLVEYALILAFISVVAIAVLVALGNQVKGVFSTITSQVAIASSSH